VTISSIGFKGTVGQSEDARRWGRMGPRFTVGGTADLKVSPAAGDRTVNIAAGSAQAGAVVAISDAVSTVSLPANGTATSGARYDLIVFRYKWTDPITQPVFTYIQGTPGGGVPSGVSVARALGTQYDGVLAIVKVAGGQGALTANDIFDVRVWGGAGALITGASDGNLSFLDLDDGVSVLGNSSQRLWRKLAGSWKYAGGAAPAAGGSFARTDGTPTLNAGVVTDLTAQVGASFAGSWSTFNPGNCLGYACAIPGRYVVQANLLTGNAGSRWESLLLVTDAQVLSIDDAGPSSQFGGLAGSAYIDAPNGIKFGFRYQTNATQEGAIRGGSYWSAHWLQPL